VYPSSDLKTERDADSEEFCPLVVRTPDDVRSPKTQRFSQQSINQCCMYLRHVSVVLNVQSDIYGKFLLHSFVRGFRLEQNIVFYRLNNEVPVHVFFRYHSYRHLSFSR
jgi:hypothetical protein